MKYIKIDGLNLKCCSYICLKTSEINYISFFSTIGEYKALSKSFKNKIPVYIANRFYNIDNNCFEMMANRIPDSDIMHIIIYSKDKSTSDKINCYLYLKSNDIKDESVQDIFFEKLYNNCSVPILREWISYIIEKLDEKKCIFKKIYGLSYSENSEIEESLTFYAISCSVSSLIETISDGLSSKKITINESSNISEEILSINGLDSYLNNYSEILTEKIDKEFVPRFNPKTDVFDDKLKVFAQYAKGNGYLDLYPAQKDVIQANVNTLKNGSKNIFTIGEMGSGKTAIAIGTAYTHSNKSMTNIVLCPAHLVKKWKTEIKRLCPRSDAIIIEDFAHFKSLEKKMLNKKRHRNLWLILSKEVAKYGYSLRPAVNLKQYGNNKMYFTCPECGKELFKTVKYGKYSSRMEPLTELDFLKENALNTICLNKKKYWDKEKRRWIEKKCNTKLWTAATKDNHSDWIKLGPAGWMHKKRIEPLYNAIFEKENATKEEMKMIEVLSDAKEGLNKFTQQYSRKYPIAKYIRKRFKDKIDYFIADEIHLYKAEESAQGEAFGDLLRAAKHSICLTGTLLNGYASGIFHILYRAFSSLMEREGFSQNEVNAFSTRYGVSKTTSMFRLDSLAVRKKISGNIKELPGISPIVFTKFLLENSTFINLSDIAEGLPGYEEIPVPIEMDAELLDAYKETEKRIKEILASENKKRNFNFMAQAVQTLTVYPDQPNGHFPIYDSSTGEIMAEIPSIPDILREKEHKLLELIVEKIDKGENVLVYTHWTNKTKTVERISQMLADNDISYSVLTQKIKPKDREEWFAKQVESGVRVVICNPILVETGLDLLDFTTIIFYQLGYSLFTMRQASRRSLRLNQTRDVKVYFLYYSDTIQEQVLSLMATKLQAAMSLEGKFSEEGLNSLSNNEDILTQIANSVTQGIQQTIDADIFKRTSIIKETAKNSVNEIFKESKFKKMAKEYLKISFPGKAKNKIFSLSSSSLNQIIEKEKAS